MCVLDKRGIALYVSKAGGGVIDRSFISDLISQYETWIVYLALYFIQLHLTFCGHIKPDLPMCVTLLSSCIWFCLAISSLVCVSRLHLCQVIYDYLWPYQTLLIWMTLVLSYIWLYMATPNTIDIFGEHVYQVISDFIWSYLVISMLLDDIFILLYLTLYGHTKPYVHIWRTLISSYIWLDVAIPNHIFISRRYVYQVRPDCVWQYKTIHTYLCDTCAKL